MSRVQRLHFRDNIACRVLAGARPSGRRPRRALAADPNRGPQAHARRPRPRPQTGHLPWTSDDPTSPGKRWKSLMASCSLMCCCFRLGSMVMSRYCRRAGRVSDTSRMRSSHARRSPASTPTPQEPSPHPSWPHGPAHLLHKLGLRGRQLIIACMEATWSTRVAQCLTQSRTGVCTGHAARSPGPPPACIAWPQASPSTGRTSSLGASTIRSHRALVAMRRAHSTLPLVLHADSNAALSAPLSPRPAVASMA